MVTQRYYYSLQQELSFRPRQDNPKAAPVVYTPLHGVGLPWLQKVPCHPFLRQACRLLLCSHLLPHEAPIKTAKNKASFCLSFFFFSCSFPYTLSASRTLCYTATKLASQLYQVSPDPPNTPALYLQKMDMAADQLPCS